MNRTNHDNKSFQLAFCGLFSEAAALLAFIYIWIDLGRRGMQADAMHISGQTPAIDVLFFGGAVVLITFSVICYSRMQRYRQITIGTGIFLAVLAAVFCIVESLTYI